MRHSWHVWAIMIIAVTAPVVIAMVGAYRRFVSLGAEGGEAWFGCMVAGYAAAALISDLCTLMERPKGEAKP